MDANKRLNSIRAELKRLAESLLQAVEDCDRPEELEHLNAVVQGQRQVLNNSAYLIGLALQERAGGGA